MENIYFKHGDMFLPVEEVQFITVNILKRGAQDAYKETNYIGNHKKASSVMLDLENGNTVISGEVDIVNHALGKLIVPIDHYEYF